jgi:hypothetical protein
MNAVYLDALSFLEDEREAWRPYEALADVPDDRLDTPVDDAHGWSARDLIAHMVSWQDVALTIARELAVSETSQELARVDAEWAERGDELNAEMIGAWRSLPPDEVRRRLRGVPGELRGYLTVVPETRWVKHPKHLRTFIEETLEHYDDHRKDLDAVLSAST